MGDSRSAIADDEENWEDFCKKVGLSIARDYPGFDSPYSVEAKYAKAGYTTYGLTDVHLLKFVLLTVEKDKTIDTYNKSVTKLVKHCEELRQLESDLARDASVRSKRSGV